MNSIDVLVLNFKEVRRRSIKLWTSIPQEKLLWKPDNEAMSCIEMIRHVLESEHYYHQAIKNKGSLANYESPFENLPYTTVEAELLLAAPYRLEFMETVQSFANEDLTSIQIDRSDVGYIRDLGDMLLRIAYHESVHTGQLLDYLRTAQVTIPNIWD
ncbi:DinB family protein [Lysinibacillus sp. FSL R7-0073]|uniref:DinB family protein n=1 Tax=Lysinibacillus TaxID=400634 RepID=UPI0018825CFE|nr:DinB family protein [Lysinibacillus fusiformis]MBD8520879.1 DinB family protein [Lysinibacillus fusiformis]MCR8852485.1 DinB family protein [Lysinibacillus fusiformis]MED4889640.1 DinB family protein [Lysinibacillus fusiformis]